VNLERATALGARMGGHVVLGHVDGIASLVEVEKAGDAQRTTFEVDASLAPFIAEKGSIAIEGVSLTVNTVDDRGERTRFSVMLIPHTIGKTTLTSLRVSSRANIEVDVLARYVQRQLQTSARHPSLAAAKASADDPDGGRDDQLTDDERLLEKLRRSGYA
jgi:riboflavin synthase